MSCRPEQVTGLLDGALSASDAAELGAHLEVCKSCRLQAEAERALRERLRRLPAPELPAGFETRLRARLHQRRPGPARLAWATLPLAAALLVAVWARGLAPLVAWELARDHEHCYSFPAPPAKIRSGDPAVVAAWFEARGTRLPGLPDRLGVTDLLGGRYCYLPDVSAAPHLYYVRGDHKLSVFVVPHGVRLGGVFTAEARGHAVALVRLGGSVVGVVGRRADEVEAAVRELRSATEIASVD